MYICELSRGVLRGVVQMIFRITGDNFVGGEALLTKQRRRNSVQSGSLAMAGLPAALLVLVVVFFTTEIKGVAYGVPRFQGHYHVPPPDPSVRHKRAPPSQFVMQYPSGISCASSGPAACSRPTAPRLRP